MSESANCAEQREEQTELEEAGGAEVRWFKTDIIFSHHRVHFSQNLPHKSITMTPARPSTAGLSNSAL